MMLLQGPVQDRLVMRDAVAQQAKRHERLREILALQAFAIGALGNAMKALLPEIRDLAINDGALLYNRKDADRTQLLGLLELAWE